MVQQDANSSASLPASPRFLPLLLVLFVGSGCAALIYEVVWLQLLQLVIGSTAVSLGVLLGTFMGGMCLGSLALPRLAPRRWHPLRLYAGLEFGTAMFGLLILFGMPYVDGLYAVLGHGTPGIMARGLLSAVCLLPPTLLMGATLPAIARWVEMTPRGVSWLGFFYGGNLAGAVGGCLLAGFYLLRVYDMAVATYVAAGAGATVAGLALVLSLFTRHSAPAEWGTDDEQKGRRGEEENARGNDSSRAGSSEQTALPFSPSPLPPFSPSLPTRHLPGVGAVYVVIGVSGLCALGAEVIWTRLLSLMLGATVYTFSIILAVFLLGLGIGSSVGSFLSRGTVRPRIALGACQLLLTAAIAWTAYMISDSIPYWPIDPTISSSPWYTFQLDVVRVMWAILPAACLWGASFPLALAAVAAHHPRPPFGRCPGRGQDPGRLVAAVYAANTVGAIAGSLLFSMLLIPQVGTDGAQRILIVLSFVGAVVAFLPALWTSRADLPYGGIWKLGTRLAGAAAAAGIVGWLAFSVSPVPWGVVAYGRFMATYCNELEPALVEEQDIPSGTSGPNRFCLYVGEGMNVTVAVCQTKGGMRSFHGGGKVQASNNPADMRLQRMLGHIPALVHKDPKSVLVVACGAGVTAGSFLVHPGVERIVVCDIEPLVPRFVAPMFAKENYNLVGEENADRVHVVLDDGRHFIHTTQEKFDIITSDPIDPWVKGCAALNTVEYYQMCKEHLNPGGVMALWMPIYESNEETLRSVICTFFKVFPNGILWTNDYNGGYDAVLFGQVGPTVIDLDAIQDRLNRDDHRPVRESLRAVNFQGVHDLFATYAGEASRLQKWGDGAKINTDLNLRLQYLAGMSLNSYIGEELLNDILRYYEFPTDIFVGSDASLRALERKLAEAGRR
jgi:spermidine synthase